MFFSTILVVYLCVFSILGYNETPSLSLTRDTTLFFQPLLFSSRFSLRVKEKIKIDKNRFWPMIFCKKIPYIGSSSMIL